MRAENSLRVARETVDACADLPSDGSPLITFGLLISNSARRH
jgi:hypothetical protein